MNKEAAEEKANYTNATYTEATCDGTYNDEGTFAEGIHNYFDNRTYTRIDNVNNDYYIRVDGDYGDNAVYTVTGTLTYASEAPADTSNVTVNIDTDYKVLVRFSYNEDNNGDGQIADAEYYEATEDASFTVKKNSVVDNSLYIHIEPLVGENITDYGSITINGVKQTLTAGQNKYTFKVDLANTYVIDISNAADTTAYHTVTIVKNDNVTVTTNVTESTKDADGNTVLTFPAGTNIGFTFAVKDGYEIEAMLLNGEGVKDDNGNNLISTSETLWDIQEDYKIEIKTKAKETSTDSTTTDNNTTDTTTDNSSTTSNSNTTTETTPPKTGDNSHMILWVSLLALSCGGIIITGVYGRKKKYFVK